MLFIVPVAIAQRLARTRIGPEGDADFGDPIVERAGVANRRAAFGVKSLNHVARIDAKRASEGATAQVFFDRLPRAGDPVPAWRYPVL